MEVQRREERREERRRQQLEAEAETQQKKRTQRRRSSVSRRNSRRDGRSMSVTNRLSVGGGSEAPDARSGRAQSSVSSAPKEGAAEPTEPDSTAAAPAQEEAPPKEDVLDERYTKYTKMLKMGVPAPQVQHRMGLEEPDLDPSVLDSVGGAGVDDYRHKDDEGAGGGRRRLRRLRRRLRRRQRMQVFLRRPREDVRRSSRRFARARRLVQTRDGGCRVACRVACLCKKRGPGRSYVRRCPQ